MNQEPSLCGLLLIDKMPGITSHFVVGRMKRILKIDRVGHLGTLDPFASGLLPIMIGGATRLADDVMDGRKIYVFRIQFGMETDTLDLSGATVETAPVDENFPLKLKNVLPQFLGEISQVPPVYSALKMNGMPLYEHMRGTGQLPFDIETKRRNIHVYNMEILSCEFVDGVASAVLRVECGKGTYVRCLARDLARAIGTVGHCSELRREGVEPWHVSNALPFGRDSQVEFEQLAPRILTPESMVPSLKNLRIGEEFLKKLTSGHQVSIGQNEYSNFVEFKLGEKLMLSCENILFLAEVVNATQNEISIQPRKKIR